MDIASGLVRLILMIHARDACHRITKRPSPVVCIFPVTLADRVETGRACMKNRNFESLSSQQITK